MKRITVIIVSLLTALSLISCDKGSKVDLYAEFLESFGKFDIVETKDIVLGNEVDSVVLTTKEGEKITVDNTADFYEIFNEVGFKFEDGKKYSCSAETKLGDRSRAFINMNVYHLDGTDIYESRTKKEGDDTVATTEEYHHVQQLEENKTGRTSFGIYLYKDEKAFGGVENGPNGQTVYVSEDYPILPGPESGELYEMHSHSNYLRNLLGFTEFFKYYEPYTDNGKKYDFNDFVTSEYTLYENYIVFKQITPALSGGVSPGQDPLIRYMMFSNSDYFVTQEAYCNVQTGEIELVKLYGETLWHTGEYLNVKLEIDMQIYVHSVDESDVKQKSDVIIDYVKLNVG